MSESERWEARYSEPGYLFGTAPNVFLAGKAPLLKPGQKALCVADGDGRNGVFLASLGLDVLAVDASPSAQAKARALAHERDVPLRLERADLDNWDWPAAAFDVVIAIFIQFSKPAGRKAIFDGMKQALKPGGLLLMEGYRTEQLKFRTGGPSQVEQLYTRALLEESFSDFASLEIEEHDSIRNEGCRHSGIAALIDLVGRK